MAKLVFFSFSPHWYVATHWNCRHPGRSSGESHLHVMGPFTSKEMFDKFHGHKAMKGSNLVVGLLSSHLPEGFQNQTIPSTFFRTLAYVFELAKKGRRYHPVTHLDIIRGWPLPQQIQESAPLWLLPPPETLHSSALDASSNAEPSSSGSVDGSHVPVLARSERELGEEEEEEAGEHDDEAAGVCLSSSTNSDSSHLDGLDEAVGCGPGQTASQGGSSSRGGMGRYEEGTALKLFSAAPFWCYLYNHDASKAKKTPPKTPEEMMDMFRGGCLPGWTPILGLDTEVARYNSLPPCLFMTLEALLDLTHASSAEAPHSGLSADTNGTARNTPRAYDPVNAAVLSSWDKFAELRGADGHTFRLSKQQQHQQACGSGSSGSGNSGPLHRFPPSSQYPSRSSASMMTRSVIFAPPSSTLGGFGAHTVPAATIFSPSTHSHPQPPRSSSSPNGEADPTPLSYIRGSESFGQQHFAHMGSVVYPPYQYVQSTPFPFQSAHSVDNLWYQAHPVQMHMGQSASPYISSMGPSLWNQQQAWEGGVYAIPGNQQGGGPPVATRVSSGRSVAGGLSTPGKTKAEAVHKEEEPSPISSDHTSSPRTAAATVVAAAAATSASAFSHRGSSRRSKWATPSFRLFLGDGSSSGDVVWWSLDHQTGSDEGLGSLMPEGPFNAEQMILDYAAGHLSDEVHVFGAKPEAFPAGTYPDVRGFHHLGGLLQAMARL